VGLSLAAWSSREIGSWRRVAGRHGGVLTGGPVAASRRQGIDGELAGATERTSGKEEGPRAHQKGGSTVRRHKRRWAVVFSGGGVAPVIVNESGEALQLEGGKGVRRGWLIEKNRDSGRCSPTKADDGAVQVKSRAGRRPPITDSGHELKGVLGELVRPGKMREKWGKGGGARWRPF
jgi:hypothetical protein